MPSRKLEQALHVSRRTCLQVGGISVLGLSLPQLSQGEAAGSAASRRATARSCIMSYMIGGPAQHETFDMKPDADQGVRGEFSPIATSVPGTQICEYLPKLARLAHRYALIRSVHHDGTFLGAGVHYNLTGFKHAPRTGRCWTGAIPLRSAG